MILVALIFSVALFYQPPRKAKAADIHLTTCGILSTANTTYILDNDVTATGTCFTIGASSIVLNLNGHTVTYNTSGADNKYGFANVDDAGNIVWNKNTARITNGNIVQSSACHYGNCLKSHAVFFKETSITEADHLNISYQGDDNEGISVNGSSYNYNAQIHDNVIKPNGTKRSLTHYGGFSAINVGGTGGDIDVVNNDIQGTGYSGVSYGYSRLKPLTDIVHLNNNIIKMASPVRDGYAISIGSPVNDDIGFEIAGNTINQSNGRGILINGYVVTDDPGPGLGTIHDNNIEVRESTDSGEYAGAPGSSIGIQLRFGAHNIQIYNNQIKAHAGLGACPRSFASQTGDNCIAYGIKMVGGKYAVNNQSYNNTIIVDTNNANYIASGLYADATADSKTEFYNNTVTSNSILVDMASADGGGQNFTFRSNTFIKGANPLNFRSINAGYWIEIITGHVFLDNNWQNGAGKDDVAIQGSSESCNSTTCMYGTRQCTRNANGTCSIAGGDYSLYTKWYLDVTVKDANGASVSGANVTATANGGTSETVTGTTDATGKSRLVLTEYKRWGYTQPASTNYDLYTPHTITVSKEGFGQAQAQVTMDATKSMEMVLSPSISLTKQVDKTTASPGDVLTYTINYSNPTANTFANAKITDPIPAGTIFDSIVSGGATFDGTNVVLDIGNLGPNTNGNSSFRVRVQ